MDAIVNSVIEHWPELLAALLVLATVIVKITPNKTDDRLLDKIKSLLGRK